MGDAAVAAIDCGTRSPPGNAYGIKELSSKQELSDAPRCEPLNSNQSDPSEEKKKPFSFGFSRSCLSSVSARVRCKERGFAQARLFERSASVAMLLRQRNRESESRRGVGPAAG